MVEADVIALVRQDWGVADGDAAVAAFQCDGQWTGPADLRPVSGGVMRYEPR